jgi:hypothetical protein
MPKGLKLSPRHRARLQRLKNQHHATLREITALLGYDRGTNWSIVHRALNPAHTFQRDVLLDLEQRIEQLEERAS